MAKETKVTEEINKSKKHLEKAKSLMGQYVFEHEPKSVEKMDVLLKELDALITAVNADSKTVPGGLHPVTPASAKLDAKKYK